MNKQDQPMNDKDIPPFLRYNVLPPHEHISERYPELNNNNDTSMTSVGLWAALMVFGMALAVIGIFGVVKGW